MPFKIIETIEHGKKNLCIIPSVWESKGLLRWPRKRLDVNRLVKSEAKPLDNWTTTKCIVKRLLSSYDEAIRELDLMVQNSDTEVDNATERTITIDKNDINFNALANQLVLTQREKSSPLPTVTTATPRISEKTTAAQYVLQYVDESELETIQADTHQNELETPTQIQNTIDVSQIENHLKLILENQYNMAQTLSVLSDNQKKIFHKLASLSVQIDDGFSTCNQTIHTNVVTLGESDPVESEAFIIKPIDSIQALEELESILVDKKQKSKLLKQYSFVCSPSDGKGVTCAYKVLDMFFSREFLCKCSWTGGSRNSDEVKIGLKKYKNILKFYYELVRSWDKTYTAESNEFFFKTVLKNSVKRKLSKNERASTKRMRTRKAVLTKKNVASSRPSSKIESDQENKDKDQTEMDTNEEEIISADATNDKEITEEEVEDESLC